jgi:hypothetical protein
MEGTMIKYCLCGTEKGDYTHRPYCPYPAYLPMSEAACEHWIREYEKSKRTAESYEGLLVDFTNGPALLFEREIREAIGQGKLPCDLSHVFKYELVNVGDHTVALVDWY